MPLSLIPKLPFFLETDQSRRSPELPANIRWGITIENDNTWRVTATSVSEPHRVASARIPLHLMPETITLEGTLTTTQGKPLSVAPLIIFQDIVGEYDFSEATARHTQEPATKPRIAFTLLGGSKRSAGAIQLYRYAQWLVELGFEVTIYSNDPTPPAWARLKAHYRFIADPLSRYQAINEDVVIVDSLLELPDILQARDRSKQRIFHLCQKREEFRHGQSFHDLMTPKPIFQLLNALPVGRIVVSPPLAEYFQREWRQQSFVIPNGLDPIFEPGATAVSRIPGRRGINRPFRVIQVCDPVEGVKAARLTIDALSLLNTRYIQHGINFHVDFLTTETDGDPFLSITAPFGVSYQIRSGLTPEEMKVEYQTADVVINPAFDDGFGMSTIEALASGALVIQTDNYGMERLIEDEVNALVIRRNNLAALASALATVFEFPDLRARFAQGALEMREKFSLERQFAAFVRCFREITGVEIDPRSINFRRAVGCGIAETTSIEVSEPPRFSVLVPVYNHGHLLPETLDTLRAQTYPHWEAIVVNDGSTDSTPEVMARYGALDPRFKLYHRTNGGTAAALNSALEHASFEWICWLSSDDFFKVDKLEVHARFIEALPHVRFFHSLFSMYDHLTGEESFKIPSSHHLFVPPALKTLELSRWNLVHGNTIAIHRDIFRAVGSFRAEYPAAQDYDMWLRMSLVTRTFAINKITCTTRVHPDSGTVQFPFAGILDSCRSLYDVFSDKTFPEIVPFLDIDNPQELRDAVVRAGCISSSIETFFNYGTICRRSILLEKLLEFYSSSECSLKGRQAIGEGLKIVHSLRSAAPVKYPFLDKHFDAFTTAPVVGYRYRPVDFTAEMVVRYEVALRERDAAGMKILRRYFDICRRHKMEMPDLDAIFGPPEIHNIVLPNS